MAPSPTKPILVLLHGVWNPPAIYKKFSDALEQAGFTVHVPWLPSCRNARPPDAFFEDDVRSVRSLIEKIVDAGQQVIVLMHSYGGVVASNALAGLAAQERAAHGLPGGVVHLVYICAYVLRNGQSIMDIVRQAGFEELVRIHFNWNSDGTCSLKDPIAGLYGGVPADEAQELASHLVEAPASVLSAPVTDEPWKRIPLTYVRTSQDLCVPVVYQDIMATTLRDAHVEYADEVLDAAHSPFATHTEDMVRIIQKTSSALGSP